MLGFHMVEIYSGRHNFTDPYAYISQVSNLYGVRTRSGSEESTRITSWGNGTYAPRHQIAIL